MAQMQNGIPIGTRWMLIHASHLMPARIRPNQPLLLLHAPLGGKLETIESYAAVIPAGVFTEHMPEPGHGIFIRSPERETLIDLHVPNAPQVAALPT